jgi:hypothetical protein
MSNITIILNSKEDMIHYMDLLAGMVQRGILFNASITDSRAVITFTGGF